MQMKLSKLNGNTIFSKGESKVIATKLLIVKHYFSSGENNSHVSGSIRYGIFEGVIEMSDGDEFWVSINRKIYLTRRHCRLSLLIRTIQLHRFIPLFTRQMKLICPLKERKGFFLHFSCIKTLR